eukprot:g3063.t1
MGKATKEKTNASGPKNLTMQVLGSTKTRDSVRFERATTEAVQTLARLGMSHQELAAATRRCLNNIHGPEWHCLVGKVKAFSVHVRYWRGKSFIFEGEGLRIMVFQSAPPAPEGPLSATRPREEGLEAEAAAEQAARSKTAERASIKVLRSEMEHRYQRWVLATASASAKEVGKGGDLDSIVAAIKGSLTELTGPVWHVVATRGSGDWGSSVAFEEGQLLDFKMNGDRFLCWKHAQAPPGLFDMLTTKRISSFLFVATVLFLCVYVKVLGSCDRCCSSSPGVRDKAGCATIPSVERPDGKPAAFTVMEGCDVDATDGADLCLRNANILFFVTCGTLAGATALKWIDRSNQRAINSLLKHQLLA